MLLPCRSPSLSCDVSKHIENRLLISVTVQLDDRLTQSALLDSTSDFNDGETVPPNSGDAGRHTVAGLTPMLPVEQTLLWRTAPWRHPDPD